MTERMIRPIVMIKTAPMTAKMAADTEFPERSRRSADIDASPSVVDCTEVVSMLRQPYFAQAVLEGPISKHGSMQSLTTLSKTLHSGHDIIVLNDVA